MSTLSPSLLLFRKEAGLSQALIATRAAISRQAYSAIELGTSTPSTDVALRLAQALGTSVEALFAIPHDPLPATATLTSPIDDTPVQRADVYRVGSRWIARPLAGSASRPAIVRSLPVANALIHTSANGRDVNVEQFIYPAAPPLVVVGCDPSISVVSAYLHGRGIDLSWHEMGSQTALRELAAGNAHVAGCHLLDPASGQYNLPAVARIMPFPVTVMSFAVWDQGLVVARGNPKKIRGIEDLARPGIAIVNREPGSGSRMLLDEALAAAGVPSTLVAGYERAAASHLSVAEVVGMGMADSGVAVKAAAIALGLDFVPLRQERYDLVFPNHFLNDNAVGELLVALRSSSLKRQVEALGGYDIACMGLEPAVA
jgi:putative molybdopterin biosynthesis protein